MSLNIANLSPISLSNMQDGVIALRNVRLLDPYRHIDAIQDVLIEQGKIVVPTTDQIISQEIDATGHWLIPSMVDLCARLREPGDQQHGSLASEGLAARRAGFLHVVMPPDTRPVLENGALLAGLRDKALKEGGVHLHVLGALTKGLQGSHAANLAGLKRGGCIAVTNARASFANDDVLLRVLEYAATFDLHVFFYPEEASIAKDGCVHDGYLASKLGLTGIPPIAETIALAKQLIMVEEVGVTAHFSQLSCADSVRLIAAAKKRGLKITADVAMHQLHLNDRVIDGFNSLGHVRPPLRSEQDRLALCQGVKTGVIDAICSHHEPLSETSKLAPFAETSAGISAMDTFMSLGVTLVENNVLTPMQLVECVTKNAANIAGISREVQHIGGFVLVDPSKKWVLNANSMVSAGKNTPFIGNTLNGRVVATFM